MNKILMVEEKISTAHRIQEHFAHAGFEMLSANNGRLGFQMAKDKGPDLIITDTQVPEMSGYELCKAIKRDEDTKSIPIVVMTEQHRMEDSFMFLGIKDFLNKPVIIEELESIIRKKLDLSQAMQTLKSKILINGKSQVLSCCQHLLKNDQHWTAYFSYSDSSFLEDAIKYSPDVILMDLLMPGILTDEVITKLKLVPELKNTVFLTYYAGASQTQDAIAVQAQLIEVQYMRNLAEQAGAKEYIGAFNPVTFLNLMNIYRREFNFII